MKEGHRFTLILQHHSSYAIYEIDKYYFQSHKPGSSLLPYGNVLNSRIAKAKSDQSL